MNYYSLPYNEFIFITVYKGLFHKNKKELLSTQDPYHSKCSIAWLTSLKDAFNENKDIKINLRVYSLEHLL